MWSVGGRLSARCLMIQRAPAPVADRAWKPCYRQCMSHTRRSMHHPFGQIRLAEQTCISKLLDSRRNVYKYEAKCLQEQSTTDEQCAHESELLLSTTVAYLSHLPVNRYNEASTSRAPPRYPGHAGSLRARCSSSSSRNRGLAWRADAGGVQAHLDA